MAIKRAAGRANQVRVAGPEPDSAVPDAPHPGGVQAEPGSSVCGERPETLKPGSRASPVASKRAAGCANLIRSRPNQIRAFRT
jgi:hypothetical protein